MTFKGKSSVQIFSPLTNEPRTLLEGGSLHPLPPSLVLIDQSASLPSTQGTYRRHVDRSLGVRAWMKTVCVSRLDTLTCPTPPQTSVVDTDAEKPGRLLKWQVSRDRHRDLNKSGFHLRIHWTVTFIIFKYLLCYLSKPRQTSQNLYSLLWNGPMQGHARAGQKITEEEESTGSGSVSLLTLHRKRTM